MFVAVQWWLWRHINTSPKMEGGHNFSRPRPQDYEGKDTFSLCSSVLSKWGCHLFFFLHLYWQSSRGTFVNRHISNSVFGIEDVSSALCPCFRAVPVATVVAVLCKTTLLIPSISPCATLIRSVLLYSSRHASKPLCLFPSLSILIYLSSMLQQACSYTNCTQNTLAEMR